MKGRGDMVVAVVIAIGLVTVLVMTFAWLSGQVLWGVLG